MTTSPEYPGAPRWVKALGVIAVLALALVVGIHLFGGGGLAHMIDHSGLEQHHASP